MTDVWKTLADKWLGPAGLTLIICGIIWGVQLNWGLLQLATDSAKQERVTTEILARQLEVSITLERTSLILKRLEDKVNNMQDKVDTHQTEAEMWKERIRQNSTEHKKE